jgi:hypothetical protein
MHDFKATPPLDEAATKNPAAEKSAKQLALPPETSVGVTAPSLTADQSAFPVFKGTYVHG